MKKQLFLSVVLLMISGIVLSRQYGQQGGGGAAPSRQTPTNRGGGQQGGGQQGGGQQGGGQQGGGQQGGGQTKPTGSAAQAAQGLTPEQAILSAAEALGVDISDAASMKNVSTSQTAVNFIQSGK